MPAVKFFAGLDLDPICLFLDGHDLKIIFGPHIGVGFGFQALTNTAVCLRLETRLRLDLEP